MTGQERTETLLLMSYCVVVLKKSATTQGSVTDYYMICTLYPAAAGETRSPDKVSIPKGWWVTTTVAMRDI